MNSPKIHIFFDFYNDSWGGGNQFLKALRENFIKKGIYENDPKMANCILFNSHHRLEDILFLKNKFQNKLFFHRIDGPLSLHRKNGHKIDYKIYKYNNLIADGTIHQSEWSRKACYKFGLKKNKFEKIIINAPNSEIFFPKKKNILKNGKERKFKLIASSHSKNLNKGFELYKYLDDNLDFKRYSMTFIGNSPFSFKNINHIKVQNSIKLAELYREHDIFIFGAKLESCSNSLLEALHCGLPCVAINSASNPEVLKMSGELFNSNEECIEKIELIRNNYEEYVKKINITSLDTVADLYYSFISSFYNDKNYNVKKLSKIEFFSILIKSILIDKSLLINLSVNLFKKFILKTQKIKN